MNLVLLGVLVYVLAQLIIGMVVSRRIATEDDYLLAGRSFGYGLATFSFFATWFGAETCVSSAGKVYREGLSGVSADPFGYGACLLLMGLLFAMPLWRRKLTTLADLFRQRYSAGVERLAVLLMVPTSVFWAAAQVRAFGQVLDASSSVGQFWGITLAAGVAIIYTGFGGMRADVITDLIQGIMIILGLFILLLVIFPGAAEVKAAWATVTPERLNIFGGGRGALATLEAWTIPICGSVVAQELVSRVLATRSPETARRSAVTGALLYMAVGSIPVWFGLVGMKWFPQLEDAEQILPMIAQAHLPTFIYILFAGALVSAILSTVDSTLLAASSLTAHNLIIPLRRGITESGKVRVNRWGVVAFGVAAWWLALQAETIFGLVESASSFGSAGIFVITLFGLFTRIGGKWSAFAALTLGMAVWAFGTWIGKWDYVYLPALAAAFVAYLALGCFDRPAEARSPAEATPTALPT